MKKLVTRLFAFLLIVSFLSVDFAPALTVSAAPAETASEVAEGEENITIPEEESSEEGIVPEEESETEESAEEISEAEENTEEASSEPESVSEEPESEETLSEEEFPEEDAETSEESTDEISEEEFEEPANEEFTGPLVIVDSVELLDEGLAEGRNVGVAIDAKNFPDAGFRKYVLDRYDDSPKDGILGANEIKRVDNIDVSKNTAIKDLKGIEYFRYLTYLYCTDLGLTSLDISRNNKLETLNCIRNSITELDTTCNSRLRQLDCAVNKLTELNLSNNPNLVVLGCSSNQLKELALSKNVLLRTLECGNNMLTSLNISKNLQLQYLTCEKNNIRKLDVSKNKELLALECYDNQLDKLDVRNCTKLDILNCSSNSIKTLDVSRCKEIRILQAHINNLTKIDVKNCKELVTLYLDNNELSELDISNNSMLKRLDLNRNKLRTLDVTNNTSLVNMQVEENLLEELDVSHNTELTSLNARFNRLTSLNLSDNVRLSHPEIWGTYKDQYPRYCIDLGENNSFDVTRLPGDFDINRLVSGSLEGATIDGTVITVNDVGLERKYISYKYQCNSSTQVQIHLDIVSDQLGLKFDHYGSLYYYYTGEPIKPKVIVTYRAETLKEKVDYTVTYTGNLVDKTKNIHTEYPKVIVKGKGKLSFEKEKMFYVYPLDLSGNAEEQKLELSDIELDYTGKVQKVKPVVYSSGKKIPEKDIEYVYPDTAEGAYKEPGEYKVLVKGKSENVIGEYTVTLKIDPKNLSSKSVSKVKIKTDLKSYPYNSETGITIPNKVTVTDGKTVLTEGKDYTLSYSNHKKVGTATITVTGINGYTGTKKATYKITGKKLTSKMITVLQTLNYSDDAYLALREGKDYTVKSGDTVLEEGIDFVCVYPKSGVKPGNYKVTFKGIGEYTGSVTKTFKINKVSLANKKVTLSTTTYTYNSNGVKPVPKVSGLTEGRDYTVVYVNNKNAAGAEDAKAPYLYIKGKGGYTGTTKANPVKFTIEKAPLTSLVTLKADNVLYKDKNNNYVTKFTLTEKETGKKLAKGKDYDKVKYEYKLNGKYTEISSGKCPAEATSLRITVYASENGNYSGSISTEYSFYTKQISKAKVQAIAAREYNGQQVRPLPVVTMTVKNNGKTETVTLVRGRDYVLEYGANNKVGTGTVMIKGIGDYGGSKTVKFKITKKVIK